MEHRASVASAEPGGLGIASDRIAPKGNRPEGRGPSATTPWLTISEAAEYLRVGVSTLRKAIAKNDGVPHRHIGRRVVLNRNELDRWLDTKPGVRVGGTP